MKTSYLRTITRTCITMASLFAVIPAAFAVNPVPGIYAGLTLGGSYSPNINLNYLDFTFPRTMTSATLQYSFFGDIAGQVGYRFDHFRVEGELMVNYNPYQNLTTPYGFVLSKPSKTNLDLAMKGQTTTGALMLNGFYDLFTPGQDSYFSPYVGLGIGYAYVNNSIDFYILNHQIPESNYSISTYTPAAQGVVGLGYFLDDFTKIGLDFRYFSTKSIAPYQAALQIASINLTFNGSFDCG